MSSQQTSKVIIPEELLPGDGRFGCGPSLVREEQVESLSSHGRTLLGTSHRQAPVKDLVRSVQDGLRELLNIPDGYEVVMGNGGATAFWDISCASLISRKGAFGSFGSFSAKFAASEASAPFLEKPAVYSGEYGTYKLPEATAGADVYAWAQNETSTGVMASVHRIEGAQDGALMLIDATSCAGAVPIDISQTDAYYFSPQKVLGSEGGLWVAVLSPAAIARAYAVEESAKLEGAVRWIPPFLSLTKAIENSRKNQTLNTPALATLLLMNEQISWINSNGGLDWASSRSAQSAQILYEWAEASTYAEPFVKDVDARSSVVATVDIDESIPVASIQAILRDSGIVDIGGYRQLGRNQLRVGVFPSVKPADVFALTKCVDYAVEQLTQ